MLNPFLHKIPPEILFLYFILIIYFTYTFYYNEDLLDNVRAQYQMYRDYGDIKCFINVGGNDPSFGDSSVIVHADGGILTELSEKDQSTGLVQLFLRDGTPVVHLLNIKSIAAAYGLPIDPSPVPAVGKGGVYERFEYNQPMAAAGVLAAALLLTPLDRVRKLLRRRKAA